MNNLEYYNKLINQNTMKKILFILLCSLFLFTACSDDDERSETAPYLRIPEIAQSLHYLKDVQRENIKIETNCEDWTITSDKDWCDAHRISSNPQMFRLALDENNELNLREAKLTLKASGITKTITVKQLGTQPAILVSPEKLDNLSDTKNNYELVITTNVSSFKWDIPEEDKTWLSISEAPMEGLTRAMISSKYLLTVQSNIEMKKRSSTIIFTGTGNEEEHPTAELPIIQKKRSTDVSDVEVGEDIKIKPNNGWASSEQTDPQAISHAFDGYIDDNHCYHTQWGANAENLGVKNAKWDKEDGLWVPRDCYNSYFFPVEDNSLTILDRLKYHSEEVSQYLDGGAACHLNLNQLPTVEQAKALIEIACRLGVPYWTTNVLCTICKSCGTIDPVTRYDKCHTCGSKELDYGTRVIGYLKPISSFAKGRQIEAAKRHYMKGIDKQC